MRQILVVFLGQPATDFQRRKGNVSQDLVGGFRAQVGDLRSMLPIPIHCSFSHSSKKRAAEKRSLTAAIGSRSALK